MEIYRGALKLKLARIEQFFLRSGSPDRSGKKWRDVGVRYSLAVAAVVIAALLREWLVRSFGQMPPFIMFYPAVLLVASLFGGGPGILVTLLSVLLADYLYLLPSAHFGFHSANDNIALGVFGCAGLFLSIHLEKLHHFRSTAAANEALRESNNVISAVLDSLGSKIAVLDENGVITMLNESWRQFAHEQCGSTEIPGCVGKRYLDVCSGCFSGENDDGSVKAASAGVSSVLEGREKHFGMEYIWRSLRHQRSFVMNVSTLRGAKRGAVIAHTDITRLKEIEQALKSSEEIYRQLFNIASNTIILHDWVSRQILDVNPAGVELYGYTPDEFIRLRADDLFAEPAETQKTVQNNKTVVPYRLSRKKDGTVFPVEMVISYFEHQGRKVYVASISDLTEQVRVKQQLTELNQNMRDLNEHILAVVEQERLAIARDIHDDLGQNLTILKIDLAWMANRIPEESIDLHERLNEMRDTAYHFFATIQRIASNLRPPLLDNAGLTAAIEWHLGEFKKHSGLECFLMLNEDLEPLDIKISTVVMRIIQEGLTNVIRHARATEVSISLCKRDGNLILEIADNGCGITPEELASPQAYGLMGMSDRARICKGNLEISGNPGCGTTLHLSIPLTIGGCTE